MTSPRVSYDESCKHLQQLGWVDQGTIPPIPDERPRFDDEVLGVNFFRTRLADDTLENLTLPRTYFGKSEIVSVSFKNTDLSESTLCWNNFKSVDFSDADLFRSDLRASIYNNVTFNRANLREADLRRSTFDNCDFSDAEMAGAKLIGEQGKSISLSEGQRSAIEWQSNDGEEPDGG